MASKGTRAAAGRRTRHVSLDVSRAARGGADGGGKDRRAMERSARARGGSTETGGHWLYGRHAVLAALANPRRRILKMAALAELAPLLTQAAADAGVARPGVEVAERAALAALLPAGAVHQGMAVLAAPLDDVGLEGILAGPGVGDDAVIVVLDQAADPRNVGAVLRSAAAFGATAVVMQDRHAPPATGVLAKAASGALESVPLLSVVNIARALRLLQEHGFFCLGLDAAAGEALGGAPRPGRVALVVGAEGAGLRRLVRQSCDALARIPITAAVESLNVSVAAAIALYAVAEARRATLVTTP